MKYRRALALQKLDRDPNGVFMEFKYHFVWNVIHRKPVFRGNSKYFGFVQDTFLKCGELVGGFTGLLWLAPDHVHIYVESDGEKSVETIIHKIKEFSENAIVERFPDVRERVATGIEIWDEAYFAETVG
jgi:REP element-mobilizing transposase RayT